MNLFGELLVQCFYVTGEVRFSTKLWPNDTEAPTDMTQLFCICHQNFYPTNWKWLSFVIEFIKIDLVLMNMCGLLCLHSFGGNRTGWVLPFSLFYSDFIRSLQKVLNPFQINGFFFPPASNIHRKWSTMIGGREKRTCNYIEWECCFFYWNVVGTNSDFFTTIFLFYFFYNDVTKFSPL